MSDVWKRLEVFLNPRKSLAELAEDANFCGDNQFTHMPFCSHDIFLREDTGNLLEEFFLEPLFLRQADISQLQNLTPEVKQENVYFSFPVFPHKRYHHARMVAMMAAHLVKELGFSREEAFTFTVAAAFHDAATVAGGDAIRCAFDELCEERNFTECLEAYGLVLKFGAWGFDLAQAQECVEGKGWHSDILNSLDRISYTILDCHFLTNKPRTLIYVLKKYPLFGDVWRDMRLGKNGEVYFADVEGLYAFLLVRALMHLHLYKNPVSRRIEHIVAKETRKLLAAGVISFDDLKKENDSWLSAVLEKNGCSIRSFMTPDIVAWKKFARREDCERYAALLGSRLVMTEHIKPFKIGLDWLVEKDGEIKEIGQILPTGRVNQLKTLSRAREGWYVYFYVND